MTTPIADYALLGDARTAALVSRDGSIDWLCLPRFDSASVFARLLGSEEHGCWSLRPTDAAARAIRRYEGDTFELVTRWETETGVAEVHDVMPVDRHRHDVVHRVDLVRRIVGIEGEVEFAHLLRMRFDYARAVPWVRQLDDDEGIEAIAGPDALLVRGVKLTPVDHAHEGRMTVAAGETRDVVLTWHTSFRPAPDRLDVDRALAETRAWWEEWAEKIAHDGPHREEVSRSLLILRALSHHDTGGIVAAPTTSLPEQFGGERNWDYRFVWLRDAALTLQALIAHGFLGVAHHWRDWLLRAVAGDTGQLQIVYGLGGERDLTERSLSSLPGYDGSAPVRIGNGAALQFQADVIGEVLLALSEARAAGLEETSLSWSLQRALLAEAERRIDVPDNGIWEIRGEPQMFTHSRVMTWAAFDRGIRAVEEHGLTGPVDRWRELRDRVRTQVDQHGVRDGGFVQHEGTDEVDASLLLIPKTGYCAADDPRMLRTVERIEQTLVERGLVRRYRPSSGVDGLHGDENAFLACSFWLVEQYAAMDRRAEAEDLLDRLCALANDVGMLSEEYDAAGERQAGNTPQAFSHLALIGAADAVARAAAS